MEWIKAFLDKNIIYEENFFFKRIQNSKFKFWIFFCYTPSSVLSLFRYNFCSQVLIGKKITFPWRQSFFLSFKKVSKNLDKNSAHRYLPEIPFVPQRGLKWRFMSTLPRSAKLRLVQKVSYLFIVSLLEEYNLNKGKFIKKCIDFLCWLGTFGLD